MELELGTLRRGAFAERLKPRGEESPWSFGVAVCWATGEEAGRGIAAAEDKESRFRLPASAAPSLFVDCDMAQSAECAV